MKKILKNNSMLYALCFMFLVFLPTLTFAAVPSGQFDAYLLVGANLLTILVYIVIGIAMIVFFWGIIKYVINGAENEEKRRDARNTIIYGIIGIFVMVSIWGIVYFLLNLLGVTPGGTPDVPGFGLPTGGLPAGADSTLVALIKIIGGWITKIAILMIGLALVLFLWGITKFIASGADEEKRTEARRVILYGVLGLFMMIGIWSIVYLVGSVTGISIGLGGVTPQIESLLIGNIGVNGGPVTITGTAMTTCDNWATTKSFKSLVCLILKIFKPIPPILVALALLYFFWGIGKYMNSGGDAEKLQNGRATMIYGVLGMFVLLAVWALVDLLQGAFGLG